MDRRSFLKALGLGSGVSALQACGLDDNYYYTPIEQILPYVVRPEQITPGTPAFFATAVGTGPAAYPVLAVHREGRVVNVNANRKTAAAPAVPSSALFELQRHYSPDRLQAPAADGADVAWEDGLKKLADAVAAARSAGKKVAYLGGYRTGALAALVDQFTGGNAVYWEPLGRAAEANAAEALLGSRRLPRYHIDKAGYVLSFGAEFLGGSWGGAWSQAAYAEARNPNTNHVLCRYALVSAAQGQAGANADDWYAATPGSEAAVALAVAKLVAEAKHYTGPAKALVAGGDVAAAAAASGLTEDAITKMAEQFAAAPAVALPGGVAGASAAATDLAAAVMLLNIVSGHGLMTTGGFTGAVHGHKHLAALIEDMKAGNVGVLVVDGANPVHALPGGAFAEALANVGLAVSVSGHNDETASLCGLALPASDTFEDWGHEEPVAGFHILRQPAQTPLYNTRSLGDILLATWRATDPEAAQGSWKDYLTAHWASQVLPTIQAFHDQAVAAMGDHGDEDPHAHPDMGKLTAAANAFLAAAAVEGDGEDASEDADPAGAAELFTKHWEFALTTGAATGPEFFATVVPAVTGTMAFAAPPALAGAGNLILHAFEHPHLFDGRYANQPWAQEAPEPLTGQVWDSYILIHPETAASLGVADNDLVTVQSDNGTLEVGVEVQAFVRKDVVAIAFGQGHSAAAGRYADGMGKNVVDLLGDVMDSSGELAWQQAKVNVSATGKKADLVSTFGGDFDEHRNWAANTPAAVYAEQGDKAQHHGGEFTGIHHLPMDQRLQDAGITGFYPPPDHPTYRFGLTVDTDACTGCGACSVACYAENNLPVVGKVKVAEGREMGWIRVNRYVQGEEIHFVPLMCQQCGHAPCESVCPVLATYHNVDGLNAMIYNRCVGTRYCSNACPYSARKFNYHSYIWPEPFNLQLNPDVVTRTMGVMEKCTFCIQKIRRVKSAYKSNHGLDSVVPDEALVQLPACADACPSQAMTFGNLNDAESHVSKYRMSGRSYIPIAEINTYPAVNYMAKASFHVERDLHHGGGHGEGHGDGHGEDHAKSGDHADHENHNTEPAAGGEHH